MIPGMATPTNTPSANKNGGLSDILGITGGAVVAVLLLIGCIFYCTQKRTSQEGRNSDSRTAEISTTHPRAADQGPDSDSQRSRAKSVDCATQTSYTSLYQVHLPSATTSGIVLTEVVDERGADLSQKPDEGKVTSTAERIKDSLNRFSAFSLWKPEEIDISHQDKV